MKCVTVTHGHFVVRYNERGARGWWASKQRWEQFIGAKLPDWVPWGNAWAAAAVFNHGIVGGARGWVGGSCRWQPLTPTSPVIKVNSGATTSDCNLPIKCETSTPTTLPHKGNQCPLRRSLVLGEVIGFDATTSKYLKK